MAEWEDVPENEMPGQWQDIPEGVPLGELPPVPTPQEAFLRGIQEKALDFKEGIQEAYYGRFGEPQLSQGIVPGVERGITERARLATEREQRRAEYEPIQEIYPGYTTAGEAAAYLPSAALPGGPIRQAVYSAGLQGMQYDSSATNMGMAAGLTLGGYAGGKLLPRIANIVRGSAENVIGRTGRMAQMVAGRGRGSARMAPELSAKDKQLLQKADELEMFTFPSMRWGSKPMSQIEQSAKATPFLSGMTEQQIINNQGKLNRLALKQIGEEGDIFLDDTFDQAARRIGGIYDDITSGKTIKINPNKFDDIRPDISEEAETLLNRYMRNYPELETGAISGEQFSRLRNRVAKDVRTHLKRPDGDPEGVSMIQNILEKSLEEQVPGSKGVLRDAGKQWKNLKALEAIGSISPEGNVNPRAAGNRLRTYDLGGFWRGRNKSDYYQALRIGRRWPDMFMTGPAKSSETATLQWMARAASDPGTTATGLLMRPIYKSYLESGGDLGYASMLGAIPRGVETVSTRAGATTGRGAAEFEDLR